MANSCGPVISFVLWNAQALNRFFSNISLLFHKNYFDALLIVLTLHIFPRSCTCLNNNIIANNLFILQVYINHPLAYNEFQTEAEALDIFFFLPWNFWHGTAGYSHMVLQLPIRALLTTLGQNSLFSYNT